jgi:hypothetical protein
MGYFGSSNRQRQSGMNMPVPPSLPRQKAPEPDKIRVNLDPTNPVETVFSGIGGLFQGVVGAGVGIAEAVSKVPVIGDVGKAVAGGLGAFGEVGVKGIAQVKDVAKVGLDLVSIPGQVVQAGSAAVRASEIFGPLPEDVKARMNRGDGFGDIVSHLVSSNRAFSDNTAANLGFALVSDPLNYVNPLAPISAARHVSKLAKLENVALSKADDIAKASKAGKVLDPQYESMLGKRPGDIRKEVVGSYIGEDDLNFLNRWRIAGELYDATIGKVGKPLSALVDAVRTPVVIGMLRSLGDVPKGVIEGLDGAGRSDLASNFAKSLARGLTQTTVFSMSRLFSRTSSNVGRYRAQQVIKKVSDGTSAGKSDEVILGELATAGLVADPAGGVELLARVKGFDDAGRRQFIREQADAWSRAEAGRAGAAAGGDYKTIQQLGGLKLSDTIDESTGFISEGARRYENLSDDVLESLFIEKGSAALTVGGRGALSATLGGLVPSASSESQAILRELYRKLGTTQQEKARLVQLAEIAAYGSQATTAASLRAAMRAASAGDKVKFEEIIGTSLTVKAFDEIKAILATEEGAKLLRLNLVRANSITQERLETILSLADQLDSKKAKQTLAAQLPDELQPAILAATTKDELAQAIVGYFPDLGLVLGRSDKSIWDELKAVLDEISASKQFVTKAGADEIASLKNMLNKIAPGAGNSVEKALSAGKYSLGFSPESGTIRRGVARATDDGAEFVDEPIMPFVDTTEDVIEGIDIGVDTFKRSGLRRVADRWLTPISSKVVEQEQLDNAIRIVTEHGGSIIQARRLVQRINELAMKKRRTPRSLVIDEAEVRDVMSDVLGTSFQKVVDGAGKGSASRIIMKIYSGSKDVVGTAQAATGKAKVSIPALAVLTDFIYPNMKFKLNPLFYIQEAIESPFFNYLRGIQRQLTGPQYQAKHGWARNLPFVETKLGEKLKLSNRIDPNSMEGTQVDPSVAALSIGTGDSALASDLDIAQSVIFLQGSQAHTLMQSEAGRNLIGQLRNAITRGPGEIINTAFNPYPMKQERKLQMTFNLALEEMANGVKYKFPQQWVAISKTYGTNNPRVAMVRLLNESARGWVNPVSVIDSAKPRNFAFAGPGSEKAASALRNEVDRIAALPVGTAAEMATARASVARLTSLVDKSAAAGNDTTMITKAINKALNDDINPSSALASLKSASDEAYQFSVETAGDFKLLEGVINGMPDKGRFRGFSQEKIAASLAKHRNYGADFPGMERVIVKLRSGAGLDSQDMRIVELSVNSLLDIHGPEEALLSAFKECVRDANDVANRIHFYNPRRSAFERSLNHPYLGFYPLSYMAGKVVPEFARALFVKFPFTNRTRPFAGYEFVREVQDHLATVFEQDPELGKFATKSDTVFLFKQLFPGLPGDISAGAPRWLNRSYAQYQRSQRPPTGNREPAQFDVGYIGRQVAEQAGEQGLYGVLGQVSGAFSEAWDFFDGEVDFNEPD